MTQPYAQVFVAGRGVRRSKNSSGNKLPYLSPLTLPSPPLFPLRGAVEREWEPVTYFRTSPNTLVWSLVLARVLLTVSLIGLSAGRLAAAELSDQLAARPSSDADECFELALSIPYLFRMGKEAEAIACYERLLQLSRKWMVAS